MPDPQDANAPAPSPVPSTDQDPVADAPVELPQHVAPGPGEVGTQQPADDGPEGAPAAPWIAAGGIALVLALVAAWWFRRASAPPSVGLGAPSEPAAAMPPDDAGPPADTEPAEAAPAEEGGFARLARAMSRTASAFRDLFGRPIDDALVEELEDALLVADVGMDTTTRLLDAVRAAHRSGKAGPDALRDALRAEMLAILADSHAPLAVSDARPWVLLVVGVNGSGKTTTIGKLAARFRDQGLRVLLAAGDTYRAAAAEQLAVWADRAGADLVRHGEGADPGAVVYDALQAARARGHDVVIVDTAGRLQTRRPLMEQLAKIRRVIAKVVPDGPHETLLVIDGTMGQNALSQARLFHEATPLTGVAVTKLDGTAKGGVVLAVAADLGLPVKLVGVGEKVDDLRDFEPEPFVDALLSTD